MIGGTRMHVLIANVIRMSLLVLPSSFDSIIDIEFWMEVKKQKIRLRLQNVSKAVSIN
jgi:hypothetical protein